MRWCWHKWGELEESYNGDHVWLYVTRWRTCQKCRKRKRV